MPRVGDRKVEAAMLEHDFGQGQTVIMILLDRSRRSTATPDLIPAVNLLMQ